MEIKKGIVLDILDQQEPALSATSDMPVIETKPDSVAQAAVDETKQLGESATSTTDEAPAEPAKKESRGVQKALDRLTSEREEQRRRAETAEAELTAIKAKAKPEVEVGDEPKRPNRNDYQDTESYERAYESYSDSRAEWTAKKVVKEARDAERKAAEEVSAAEHQRKVTEGYNERKEKAKTKYADFSEVAESEVTVPMPIVHAILTHPEGPELQYYFGKNPDEAQRLATLDPLNMAIELGVILTKINPKPQVSAAPKPIKPLGASKEAATKDPEGMSMDEYAAHYKQREKDRNVRH